MFLDAFSKCDTNIRLDGKVAIVTGATSGTGLEIAKNLHRKGAKVIIASRNQKKLDDAKKEITKESIRNDNVVTRIMDFESLASVRRFVNETKQLESRVDILVNNIGAVGLENRLTADNLELMMQVNYFGMFLLTYLLFPLMKASAPSRIVSISSLALLLGQIEIDHLNDLGRYSNFGIYSNAKLATVLQTVEMNKRIQGSGVSVFSMDPGLIRSDFFRHYPEGAVREILTYLLSIFGRPAHRVATVPVYLALDPKLTNSSGKHYLDCVEYPSHWNIHNEQLTSTLWEVSKKMVGITDEEDWERFKFN